VKKFLTLEQKRCYQDKGFFSPIRIFSEEEAVDHRLRLELVEKKNGPMHYRTKPYLLMTSANEIATNSILLDAVESILGPDILLWDSAYVIKEPRTKKFVSWHQDLTYWGLNSEDLVTAWVALSPATKESGCIKILPGSHKDGRQKQRETFSKENILHKGQELELKIDKKHVVNLELKPGEVSIHHGWIAHASHPNNSKDRRIGLSLQYIATSVSAKYPEKESATLVRGEDEYKNFHQEPICKFDFDPEALSFQVKMQKLKHEVYDTE